MNSQHPTPNSQQTPNTQLPTRVEDNEAETAETWLGRGMGNARFESFIRLLEPARSFAKVGSWGLGVHWEVGVGSWEFARRRAGFTLIEILVVIIIIGVLASFIAIGVNQAMISAKTSMCEEIMQQVFSATEQYRVKFGDYPPSSLAELGVSLPNETNNGIEALVACLATRKGGPFHTPPDEYYSNVDGDESARAKEVTQWFFGDGKLREYVDAFGNPLTYVHHKDYASPKASITKYKFTAEGPDVTITIDKSGVTATFASPTKYQVRSVGHDGKWGTADDIRVDR